MPLTIETFERQLAMLPRDEPHATNRPIKAHCHTLAIRYRACSNTGRV